MIEVKEVLRRHKAGQKLRRIARETGLDRKTVRRYVEAAEGAEQASDGAHGLDDGLVQEVADRPHERS